MIFATTKCERAVSPTSGKNIRLYCWSIGWNLHSHWHFYCCTVRYFAMRRFRAIFIAAITKESICVELSQHLTHTHTHINSTIFVLHLGQHFVWVCVCRMWRSIVSRFNSVEFASGELFSLMSIRSENRHFVSIYTMSAPPFVRQHSQHNGIFVCYCLRTQSIVFSVFLHHFCRLTSFIAMVHRKTFGKQCALKSKCKKTNEEIAIRNHA